MLYANTVIFPIQWQEMLFLIYIFSLHSKLGVLMKIVDLIKKNVPKCVRLRMELTNCSQSFGEVSAVDVAVCS